jgi:hypothetical protein
MNLTLKGYPFSLKTAPFSKYPHLSGKYPWVHREENHLYGNHHLFLESLTGFGSSGEFS